MTCGGCSGAVNRVLSKAQTQGELQVSEVSGVCEQPDSIIQYMAGIVSSFDISLEKQEVNVTGSAPYETVLEIIKKTGKTVRRPLGSLKDRVVHCKAVSTRYGQVRPLKLKRRYRCRCKLSSGAEYAVFYGFGFEQPISRPSYSRKAQTFLLYVTLRQL